MPYAKTPVNANELFVQGLVREVPELAPIFQEHVEFYEELLPHVLMGDVGRFVVANAISRDRKSALARLMAYLEEGLANGPAEVQELIVASFVEYLQDEASTILTLAPVMGPRLKKEITQSAGLIFLARYSSQHTHQLSGLSGSEWISGDQSSR